MKKSLTALAVMAAVSVPFAVQAEGPTVYGTIHTSVDVGLNDETTIKVDNSSRRGWALGAKGDTDLDMGGMKAIYKFELGFDGSTNTIKSFGLGVDGNGDLELTSKTNPGYFYQRDSWVGVKGGFGQVRIGTMATMYKATGKMVDPLFTTALEGRGSKNALMSGFHAGNGVGKGRGTEMISYDAPKIADMVDVNAYVQPRQEGGETKWNYGGGAKVKAGPATVFGVVTTDGAGEMAMKFGAKAGFGPAEVAGHFEMGDALVDAQHVFASASFKATDALKVADNFGTELDSGDMGFGVAAMQKMAKKTSAYAGFGMTMPDVGDGEKTVTLGLKHKF